MVNVLLGVEVSERVGVKIVAKGVCVRVGVLVIVLVAEIVKVIDDLGVSGVPEIARVGDGVEDLVDVWVLDIEVGSIDDRVPDATLEGVKVKDGICSPPGSSTRVALSVTGRGWKGVGVSVKDPNMAPGTTITVPGNSSANGCAVGAENKSKETSSVESVHDESKKINKPVSPINLFIRPILAIYPAKYHTCRMV